MSMNMNMMNLSMTDGQRSMHCITLKPSKPRETRRPIRTSNNPQKDYLDSRKVQPIRHPDIPSILAIKVTQSTKVYNVIPFLDSKRVRYTIPYHRYYLANPRTRNHPFIPLDSLDPKKPNFTSGKEKSRREEKKRKEKKANPRSDQSSRIES
ncbi:hypothetical protein OCU04_010557 [Sclerotinia nivalis]|uniref:Uncharacterized protein n=1 Tax=Sclerotinia nivalis TaxID=352851 RepID=A0A9X0DEU9_9HELO|nr:hypothetical protein OCU04_010557 [Sclerotinia nivalis]